MKISKLNPKRSLLAKLFVFYIIPFVLFAGAMDFCFSYITNNRLMKMSFHNLMSGYLKMPAVWLQALIRI
ncbi:hypothetical protein CN689_16540 [Peribacillus butanolivorans]|uniref:Uncharacterized protein n=1 Tax=Peribacillus butanolivorans TaxID=421767 RepID=A0AAX0RRB7_9BACI|nr:hypothetical protein [Peribacillus butanolivorans]AXN39181.1 hypothetical protein DTO10_12755 [Peribacillus butanolivorans]PEJ31335.1 hypothetical protein CN689_16540 [Peribacillus butanolivorans]